MIPVLRELAVGWQDRETQGSGGQGSRTSNIKCQTAMVTVSPFFFISQALKGPVEAFHAEKSCFYLQRPPRLLGREMDGVG